MEKVKKMAEKKFCCEGFRDFIMLQTNIKWKSYEGIRLLWVDLNGDKSWKVISYCMFCGKELNY